MTYVYVNSRPNAQSGNRLQNSKRPRRSLAVWEVIPTRMYLDLIAGKMKSEVA